MSNLTLEFWDRMDDVRAGMLGLASDNRLIPMAPSVDDDLKGHVWFITARGTDLETATRTGAQAAKFVVADGAAGLYADVTGELAQVIDKEALDEVWSVFAAAWFDGGKDDPDVVLLRFTPAEAEVSASTESSAKFLYEIAKANLTDSKPDVGAQGKVVF